MEEKWEVLDRYFHNLRRMQLTEDALERIAERLQMDVVDVKTRAVHLGIQVLPSRREEYAAIYAKYYKEEPGRKDYYDEMSLLVKHAGLENLYDFLFRGNEGMILDGMPADNIRERVIEKEAEMEVYRKLSQERAKEEGSIDSETVISVANQIQKYCEEVFADDASKEDYDLYLKRTKIVNVLNWLKESYEILGEVSHEICYESQEKIQKLMPTREEARTLLMAFCRIERLPIPFS